MGYTQFVSERVLARHTFTATESMSCTGRTVVVVDICGLLGPSQHCCEIEREVHGNALAAAAPHPIMQPSFCTGDKHDLWTELCTLEIRMNTETS